MGQLRPACGLNACESQVAMFTEHSVEIVQVYSGEPAEAL